MPCLPEPGDGSRGVRPERCRRSSSRCARRRARRARKRKTVVPTSTSALQEHRPCCRSNASEVAEAQSGAPGHSSRRSTSCAAISPTPIATFVHTTPRRLDGMSERAATWTTTPAGDDPRIPCLSAGEVVADEDVRDREEPDRERERGEHRSAFGEIRPEGRDHEPNTRGGVEECEAAAEDSGGEQRPAENVFRLFAPRLTRRRAREQNGEDRRRQEEADARKRRRSCVRACLVGEARLDDQEVDMREECDADQSDRDRSEVADKRPQVGSRGGSRLQKRADQEERQPRAGERAEDCCEHCAAEAISGRSRDREDHETQGKWDEIERGERMEALASLDHAHRDRRDQVRWGTSSPRAERCRPSRCSGSARAVEPVRGQCRRAGASRRQRRARPDG